MRLAIAKLLAPIKRPAVVSIGMLPKPDTHTLSRLDVALPGYHFTRNDHVRNR